MEPGEIGARSGIYRALYRPTGTRHQEPNPTNPRRSFQGVLSRGFRHNQICRTAPPEQWKALTFSGMELSNSARRLTIRFLFAYTDWHAGRTRTWCTANSRLPDCSHSAAG